CLLLRAAGRSWPAAAEAMRLRRFDEPEARRLVEGVARGLENSGRLGIRLTFDAARLRAACNGSPSPEGLPFPGLRGDARRLVTGLWREFVRTGSPLATGGSGEEAPNEEK